MLFSKGGLVSSLSSEKPKRVFFRGGYFPEDKTEILQWRGLNKLVADFSL